MKICDIKLMKFWEQLGVQVGRMGYVPAYGGNGNSRNVSCSNPACTAASALGKERYINGFYKKRLRRYACGAT